MTNDSKRCTCGASIPATALWCESCADDCQARAAELADMQRWKPWRYCTCGARKAADVLWCGACAAQDSPERRTVTLTGRQALAELERRYSDATE